MEPTIMDYARDHLAKRSEESFTELLDAIERRHKDASFERLKLSLAALYLELARAAERTGQVPLEALESALEIYR